MVKVEKINYQILVNETLLFVGHVCMAGWVFVFEPNGFVCCQSKKAQNWENYCVGVFRAAFSNDGLPKFHSLRFQMKPIRNDDGARWGARLW